MRKLIKPALLFALSGLVLSWAGNFVPDKHRTLVSYLLASLFGLILGAVILPDWTQVCVLGGAAIAAYFCAVRTAIWIDERLHSRGIVFSTAGMVGAVLMTLAVCLWRREFRGALPVAVAAGLLGGAVFAIGESDLCWVGGHIAWQVLVGLALVHYGRKKAAA